MYKLYAVYLKGNYEKIYYIGQTKKTLKQRENQHKYLAKKNIKNKFLNWIKFVNFEIELVLLETRETKIEIDMLEKEYINKIGKTNLKNTADGGDGGGGLFLDKNHKAQKILQYSLEGNFIAKFNSITEACNSLNIKFGKISNCISLDRVKSEGGFIWKKWTENFPIKIEPITKKQREDKRIRYILQYDSKGNLLNRFRGRNKAADYLKVNKANILWGLKSKNKYAVGYYWFYEDEGPEKVIQHFKHKQLL